jgi:hypothetical protein
VRDWLWAICAVLLPIALMMGVAAAMTRFWIWPLVQADSPWQYVAFACTVLTTLAIMFGSAVVFIRSAGR